MARTTVLRRAVDGAASPLDISDNVLTWLRADSIADYVGDGGNVEYWRDDSVNQWACAQATVADRPSLDLNVLNGHAAVYFDGTEYLTGNPAVVASGNYTTTVVLKNDNAAFESEEGIFGGTIADNNQRGPVGTSGVAYYKDNAQTVFYINGSETFTPPDGINQWHIMIQTDTTMLLTAGYNCGQTLASAAGRWTGHIAEIIFSDGLMSAADRSTMFAYLNAKYKVY